MGPLDHDQNAGSSPTGGEQRGLGRALLWHAASFVLPAFSLRFYRISRRRRFTHALTFFALFASVLCALFSLRFARNLTELDAELQEAMEAGGFPAITIEQGIASIAAPQPLVLLDQAGQLFVLDTTGTYTDIDPARYREGILLTRTELIVLDSSGQRQSLRLAELNQLFNTDPIIIDEAFVMQTWDRISRIALVIAVLGLWIWHFFVRLLVLAVVGLLIWGSVSVLRNQTDYGAIMITGLYATVPALYLHYLLARVGLSLPGVQTMILMLVWMGIAIAILDLRDLAPAFEERDLLRMTPIGLPMLFVLAWDVVFSPDIEPLALWGVPILTFIAWMVMRRLQVEDIQPPADPD